MKHRVIIFLIVLLACQVGSSQEESSSNVYEDVKWSVGPGIGYDYAIVGVKLGYHLKNSGFSLYGSGSYLLANSIGVEYQFTSLLKKKAWCPYVLVGYYTTNIQQIQHNIVVLNEDGTSQPALVEQDNSNSGICASLGTHIAYKDLGFWSIAASARYAIYYTDIEEFNQQFNTNYTGGNRFLLRFSLGYNFMIASHN